MKELVVSIEDEHKQAESYKIDVSHPLSSWAATDLAPPLAPPHPPGREGTVSHAHHQA